MSKKAWKLTHRRDRDLIKFTLTMFGESRTLTVDVNAPPLTYIAMQNWFLDLFQKIWWTERDSRNFLFYNQVIDDFIRVMAKHRNEPHVKFPDFS